MFTYIVILSYLTSNNIISSIEQYINKNRNFKINYEYLLSHKVNNKPIVIESIELNDFFSPNPLFNSKKMNIVFLNMGFLNSYECYKSSWNRLCNCNPLSLIEKLEYISENNVLFISDLKETVVYKKYIKLYWNRDIDFIKIEQVNENIYSFKVNFN